MERRDSAVSDANDRPPRGAIYRDANGREVCPHGLPLNQPHPGCVAGTMILGDANDKPDMVAVEERWHIGADGKPDSHEVRIMDANDMPVRHRRLCRVSRGGDCNCFPLADGETEEAVTLPVVQVSTDGIIWCDAADLMNPDSGAFPYRRVVQRSAVPANNKPSPGQWYADGPAVYTEYHEPVAVCGPGGPYEANARLIAAAPPTKRERDEAVALLREARRLLGLCYNSLLPERPRPISKIEEDTDALLRRIDGAR